MTRPTLHVVPADPPENETVAAKVRRLQAEARSLAKDHVRALTQALADVEEMAREIAAAGDAYAPGVPDFARRLADDCANRAQTLTAINSRS